MDTTVVTKATKLCEGLFAIMGKSAKVKVAGKEVKISVFLDTLGELAKSHDEMMAARAAFLAAAAKHRELLEQADVKALYSVIVAQLRTMLTPEQLQACGLAPKKRHVLTAEERVLANAKARTTRTAKGTLGAKERREREVREALASALAADATSPPAPAPVEEGGRANGAH